MITVTILVLNLFLSVMICVAQDADFVPLFDGKTLDGWEGEVEGYEVKDGLLVCRPGASGKLLTEQEFSDFDLRFEFLLAPDANNGVAIRAPLEGDAAYEGMEVQILDNETKKYGELLDFQFHGSLYGIAPALRGYLKPAGEWNQEEIHCQGRHVTVTLNGTKILDVNLDEVAPNGVTVDKKEHPGLKRTSGRVGFLSHGDEVSFRNIEIRDNSQAATAKSATLPQ
ncbi:MAG: DUF1080 domain-containing protein [Bythopirellula sp.]|nr:DUF1080 domain-containing protein [Bythopirellula sp.]